LIDTRFATFDFDPPMGQWVCMPLWSSHECMGMLVLDNAEVPGLLNPTQSGLLQLFQRQINAALERARLYEAERQKRFQRDWLKTLTQVIEETLRAQTVQQVADIIVRRGKWLGFRRARLWRLSEDEQRLIGVSQEGTGELEPFADIVLALADLPVLSRALQQAELVLSDDRRDSPGVLDNRFAPHGFQPPDGKWVVLPLLINGGRPWGILVLDSALDERLVHQEQSPLLELFRRQATAALERAQLHEQHAEMLAQLHEMVLATPNRHDQTELLPKIVRAALDVLRAKIVILYPMNRRGQSFSIIAAGKIDGRTPLIPPDAHDNIVSHIAEQCQAYYQPDARGDTLLVGTDAARHRTFTVRQGIRSLPITQLPTIMPRRVPKDG
jgi:GAF domain-containing protein